jgi:hypothetical protein
MASQSWTLKAEFQAEKRRLKDWVPADEEPTVTLVRSGVGLLFDMSPALELKLQYNDNEGDVCTLTDMTLSDALSVALQCAPSRTSRTLCVMVELVTTELVEPVTTEPADRPDCIRAHLQDGSAPVGTSLEMDGTNTSNGASSSLQARAQQLGETTANLQAIVGHLVENNKERITSVRATGEHINSEIQTKLQEGRGSLEARAQQLGETTASLQAIAGHLVEHNKARIASVHATGEQISSEIQTKLHEGLEGFEKRFGTRSQQLRGDLRGSLESLAQQLGETTASLQAITGHLMEENKERIASVRATGGQISSEIQIKLQEGREGFEKGFEIRSQQLRNVQESAGSELSAPLLHTDA